MGSVHLRLCAYASVRQFACQAFVAAHKVLLGLCSLFLVLPDVAPALSLVSAYIGMPREGGGEKGGEGRSGRMRAAWEAHSSCVQMSDVLCSLIGWMQGWSTFINHPSSVSTAGFIDMTKSSNCYKGR